MSRICLRSTARHALIFSTAFVVVSSWAASQAQAKPWKGAEIITHETFEFGAFEARILAARGSGMITPFFLWKNNSELFDVPWQEQDFEIFGEDGSYQTQLMTPGEGGRARTEHERYHELPEPAWERYYTYRMEWTPERLAFYVDGEVVRVETNQSEFEILMSSALAEPAQLRLSLWAGDSGWSGAFDETAVPAAAFIDWVEVSSYTPGSGPGGGDFSVQWRDNFDSFDDQRWGTANWTFDFAVNDYVGQNADTRDGKMVLVFTDDNSIGRFPTVPGEGTSEGSETECRTTSTEIAASQMSATTGGLAGSGWNLWSNGSLAAGYALEGGPSRVEVVARGQFGGGAWPHMIVEVGGQQVGQVVVNSASNAVYAFDFDAPSASTTLRVRFDNDYFQDGEDRNLLVESVNVVECLD